MKPQIRFHLGGRWIARRTLTWLLASIVAIAGTSETACGADASPREAPFILTPPAPPQPRINGPLVYGVRPGSPFLYRIPCTGQRPIEFSARHLPAGLTLDAQHGIITGTLTKAGTNRVILFARNTLGQARREFRIIAGHTLALTPPMGWNSWYIHYDRVSDALMRQAADQMIATGMADYGYQYVNIDDCWMKKQGDEPYRDPAGTLLPNRRFPDMKGLADYIHGQGLKAGLYTSPGPWTCGGYTGAYQHETQDAQTFANWGFDFLKYDWCSYGEIFHNGDPRLTNTVSPSTAAGLAGYQFPYQLMRDSLRQQHRDLVLNLCQYGMADVWQWGGEVGNSWRTTGDLGLERSTHLPGFYSVGFSNAKHWEYARPGAWNDPVPTNQTAPQLFPTPPELAARMVELAEIQPGQTILEPSAGTGNLLAAIMNDDTALAVVAVEINQQLADRLKTEYPLTNVQCQDFLTFDRGNYPVDCIIMNPPFAPQAADIQHIKHALTMLKPGGRLVALCANGPRQQAALQPLADLWEVLPPGSFAAEGTNVNVVLLVINKPTARTENPADWKEQPLF